MEGGSYEKLPDGTLKKIEPVIEKPPVEMPTIPTPADVAVMPTIGQPDIKPPVTMLLGVK